jgi:hypothetical protein
MHLDALVIGRVGCDRFFFRHCLGRGWATKAVLVVWGATLLTAAADPPDAVPGNLPAMQREVDLLLDFVGLEGGQLDPAFEVLELRGLRA